MGGRNMFIIGIWYCKYVIPPHSSTDSTQFKSFYHEFMMRITETDKPILKFRPKCKGPKIAKSILKKIKAEI